MYRKVNIVWAEKDLYSYLVGEKEDALVNSIDMTESDSDQIINWLEKQKISIDILILGEKSFDEWIQSSRLIEFQQTQPNATILVVLESYNHEIEDYCFLNGLKDVLYLSNSKRAAAQYGGHVARVKANHQFKQQIDEASQMALLAMTNASDLGNIIKFAEQAISSTGFKELSEALMEFVSPFSEFVLIEIKTEERTIYYGTDGHIDPDLKKILIHSKKTNRIERHDDLVEINAKGLAIVLAGLPVEDENKFGRILDSLATFVSLSEKFVEMIEVRELIRTQEKAQKRFLSIVGHELRTPLNAINGFAGVLSKKLEPALERTSEYDLSNKIQLNALKMGNLIDISLDLERMLEETPNINDSKCADVAVLLEETCGPLRRLILASGIEFRINNRINNSLPIDELRIKRIIKTLLINALDRTSSGHIELALEILQSETGQFLTINITDTGEFLTEKQINQFNRRRNFVGLYKENEDSRLAVSYFYLNQACLYFSGGMSIENRQEGGTQVKIKISIPAVSC